MKIFVAVIAALFCCQQSLASGVPGQAFAKNWHPALTASDQSVEGGLIGLPWDADMIVPCEGGTRESAVYLGGFGCRGVNEFPIPFSTPVVFVVVAIDSDFELTVIGDSARVIEQYEFRQVKPGVYRFETGRPLSGVLDCKVRLYLNGLLAGEAVTQSGTLGGVK